MMIISSWYLNPTLVSDHQLLISSKKLDSKIYVQLWFPFQSNMTEMFEFICIASGSTNLRQSAWYASLSSDRSWRIEESVDSTNIKFRF